jgi:zinc and cadmium transporter
MTDIFQIIFFVAVSGLVGLSGGLLFLKNLKFAHKISFFMVAFAVGALLAAAFLDLLPEALKSGETEAVFVGVLSGILVFFFIEKFLIWHHHHTYGEKEQHPVNTLVMIGDTIHNFIDGVILTAAFLVSPQIGIPAFIAVLMHEIPQEMSDFSIMLNGGMKRSKIILFNVVSALFSVVGAVVAYFFLSAYQGMAMILIAFAAGGFIYIALSDLIPETKHTKSFKKSAIQIAMVVAGMLVIWYTGALSTSIAGFG